MIANDFVVKQLDILLDKLPYIQARYETDAFSGSHYVISCSDLSKSERKIGSIN